MKNRTSTHRHMHVTTAPIGTILYPRDSYASGYFPLRISERSTNFTVLTRINDNAKFCLSHLNGSIVNFEFIDSAYTMMTLNVLS